MMISIVIPTAKLKCLTLKSLEGLEFSHEIIVVKAKGLGHARNKGMRQARSDLLVMLDDDLELNEGFWQFVFSVQPQQFCMVNSYGNISTRVFVIHQEDFRRIGGFDEGIKYIFEDGDFMIRALNQGMKLKVVPDLYFQHIDHPIRQRNRYLLVLLSWEYVRLFLKYKRLLARKGFIRFFIEPFDYRVFLVHFVTKLFAFPYWLLRSKIR